MPDYVDDKYGWDEEKSDSTFGRTGFDFHFASRMFDEGNYTEKEDDRNDYDEERSICTGRIDVLFVTLVYTPRGHRKRILSAWHSDRKEIDEYARWFGS